LFVPTPLPVYNHKPFYITKILATSIAKTL